MKTSENTFSDIYHDLYSRWQNATADKGFTAHEIIENRYFQQILQLGDAAIPYILKEIQENPHASIHLVTALFLLTKDNKRPEPIANPGLESEVKNSWIRWGKEHGYLENSST